MKKEGKKIYVHPDFEVTGLTVPRPTNGNISLTMYSDHNAEARKKPVNARATALARACGHFYKSIYGDAFVGRAFDAGPSNW